MILGGLSTQGAKGGPIGVIIEMTGLLRVSTRVSHRMMFGWSYPTQTENVLQTHFTNSNSYCYPVKTALIIFFVFTNTPPPPWKNRWWIHMWRSFCWYTYCMVLWLCYRWSEKSPPEDCILVGAKPGCLVSHCALRLCALSGRGVARLWPLAWNIFTSMSHSQFQTMFFWASLNKSKI